MRQTCEKLENDLTTELSSSLIYVDLEKGIEGRFRREDRRSLHTHLNVKKGGEGRERERW